MRNPPCTLGVEVVLTSITRSTYLHQTGLFRLGGHPRSDLIVKPNLGSTQTWLSTDLAAARGGQRRQISRANLQNPTWAIRSRGRQGAVGRLPSSCHACELHGCVKRRGNLLEVPPRFRWASIVSLRPQIATQPFKLRAPVVGYRRYDTGLDEKGLE